MTRASRANRRQEGVLDLNVNKLIRMSHTGACVQQRDNADQHKPCKQAGSDGSCYETSAKTLTEKNVSLLAMHDRNGNMKCSGMYLKLLTTAISSQIRKTACLETRARFADYVTWLPATAVKPL